MRSFFILLLFLSGMFGSVSTAIAQAEVQEIYSQRPSVLRFQTRNSRARLTPADRKLENDETWSKNKLGMLRFLASLKFYPKNYQFYFLGRDAEPLFDLATLLFAKDPQMRNRLHLINVSRPSHLDPNLWKYLEQEGFSEKNAAAGMEFLMIDTGMRGTIPDFIRTSAPEGLREKIHAHFLLSANVHYPSSRAFLSTLEPDALRGDVRDYENQILQFENLDYFTFSVLSYQSIQGRWEGLTGPSYQAPGSSLHSLMGSGFGMGHDLLPMATDRNPEGAARVQRNLFDFAQQPSSQGEFLRMIKLWERLRKAYQKSALVGSSEFLLSEMATIWSMSQKKDFMSEAVVRDALDLIRKNNPFSTTLRLPTLSMIKELSRSQSCETSVSRKTR